MQLRGDFLDLEYSRKSFELCWKIRGVLHRACVASCGGKRCVEDVTAEAGKAVRRHSRGQLRGALACP